MFENKCLFGFKVFLPLLVVLGSPLSLAGEKPLHPGLKISDITLPSAPVRVNGGSRAVIRVGELSSPILRFALPKAACELSVEKNPEGAGDFAIESILSTAQSLRVDARNLSGVSLVLYCDHGNEAPAVGDLRGVEFIERDWVGSNRRNNGPKF